MLAPEITKDYLIVISCGSAKTDFMTNAEHLYVGTPFKLALRYAKTLVPRDQIKILSAKYGLLNLDDLVEPYKLRMGKPGSIVSEKVKSQAITQGIKAAPKVVVFGGIDYYNLCSEVWPHAQRLYEGITIDKITKLYARLLKEQNEVPLN
jgi:hypothetical protein